MRHSLSIARRSQTGKVPHRPGFTLIEMLVATALVVLMLMLFARIFGDTVSLMRKQQSLVQNDQKARNIDTVLRNDFNKMTFRQPSLRGVTGIVPLNANWPVDANQQGFFYYSENDTGNPLDDVLHFTISQSVRARDKEVAMLRGRGQRLGRPFTSPQPFPDDNLDNVQDETSTPGPIDPTNVGGVGIVDADLNQPDYDDGALGDNLGLSSAAEVVYFVRNGNLYRRVLLIRDPQTPINVNDLPATTIPNPSNAFPDPYPAPPAAYSSQPGLGVNGTATYVNAAGTHFPERKFMRLDAAGFPIYSDYSAVLDVFGTTPGLVDFWNDFDYSAFNQWNDLDGDQAMDAFPDDRYELIFNGVDALLNHPGGAEYPIALPQHRFGHRPAWAAFPINNLQKPLGGQPMEYLLTAVTPAGTPVGFIGRFTHAETSSSNAASGTRFGYPGTVPQDGLAGVVNPFLATYNATADSNGDGIVDAFADGPRAGEDLLISNVEAFDVEIWDDGFQEPDVDHDGILDAFEDINGNGVRDFLAGSWVDLGHDTSHPGVAAAPFLSGLGNFRLGNNQNVTYGPRNVGGGTFNRIYDSWHPRADIGAYAPLPNRALRSSTAPYALYRIGGPAANVGPSGGAGSGFVGSVWREGWPMLPGHYIFPGVGEDPNGNGTIDAGEIDMLGNPTADANGNNALDPPEDGVNGVLGVAVHYEDLNHDGEIATDVDGDSLSDEDVNGDMFVGVARTDDWSYYYQVIGYVDDLNRNGVWDVGEPESSPGSMQLNQLSDPDPNRQPEWIRRPGNVIYDNGVIWRCFDNRVSLQMIRVTVRYRDPASGAPRQVSLVHSFVD